jgi:hypothetical protein
MSILCHGRACAATGCAACHPSQASAHAATRHARSLRPVAETEFFRDLPGGPIGEARGGFLFRYQREGDHVRVLAARGAERAEGIARWAFGAGAQGVTPLVEHGGRSLEHRISYYPRAGRFDLTLGHAPGASKSAEAALGIAQPKATLAACLGCHSTVEGTLVRGAGIGCERCHSGAGAHALAAGASPATHPGRLGPREEVALCAECHRLTPPGRAGDPLNIRFQPLRLVMSRCYQQGAIRCTSCHAAHADAATGPGAYRAACLSCHPNLSNKGDCVSCHMPSSSPAPYLTFTDHFIRVAAK